MKKLIVLVLMMASLSGYSQTLPRHLQSKPRIALDGQVTSANGSNVVVTVVTNVPVFAPSRKNYYYDRNNRLAVEIIPGEQIGQREVRTDYKLMNYPNWKKAKVGDAVRMSVVETTGVAGARLVYYVGPLGVKSTGNTLE